MRFAEFKFRACLLVFSMLMFSLLPSLVLAQNRAEGIMGTIAGTGEKGHTGDGGPAPQAKLNQPFHCELDGKGHLFIAEAENHCIRKVDLKTGRISTVAGTGKKGYTGDGGPATQATFNEPYAIVISEVGDMYIADRLNAVVRKIDGKTGVITTVAGTGKKGYSGDGGPGDQAKLVEPNDVHFDGKGGLLIADVSDWRIRRLDLKTGIITTFAGVGRPKGGKTGMPRDKLGDGGPATKAIIVGARAVCVDPKGTVFICEREGSSIRRVGADGVITTISGNGVWGYSGDGGSVKDAVYKGPKAIRSDRVGNLFVVDCENHAVRKIDFAKDVVTTVAGGRKGKGGDGGPATEAGMDRPHGCIVSPDGVLYIADSNNERVRVVRLKK